MATGVELSAEATEGETVTVLALADGETLRSDDDRSRCFDG